MSHRSRTLGVVALAVVTAAPAALRQPAGGGLLALVLVAIGVAGLVDRWPSAAATLGPAAAVLWLQLVVYPMPAGVLVLGVVLGLLSSLVALGMALIYRANRILNFAQADLGSVPTVLAVGLIAFSGLNYFLALAVGLIAALVLGAVVELVVIRRFFRAPRLILTVATIGLSQLLTVVGVYLPRLWGERLVSENVDVPWKVSLTVEPIVFTADHLLAVIVPPMVLVGLAVFLRATDAGVAIRASAERADRASTLGVPVKRLQTVVWALATAMSFLGVFLRAGIVGLPVVSQLSFGALLTALAALMLGRLSNLPAITAAAVAIGVLEQGVVWNNSANPAMVYPVVGAVVLVSLAVLRVGSSRADQDTAASWKSADEVRPVPAELRRLPEVRLLRWGGMAVLGAVVLALPVVLGPSNEVRAASVAVFAMVAVSILVLTGWAGQVSLGQMSFVAVGAAVGAVATSEWNADLSLAVLVAGGAGAVAAVVVGLPALRLRGLFLAVSTLAFAVASTNYLLNRSSFSWIPRGGISRPELFGYFDLTSQSSMYYVCVAGALLALVAARGARRSRTGRVLLALRDNERGVQSYGVDVTRAKLSAFAFSGFLAAAAGCLNVHLFGIYSETGYGPTASFAVFTAAVVGGLGSLAGAVLGALFLQGGEWFLPGAWQLLPSALGVLLVLLVLPGGLGDLVYRLRDGLLRRIAARRGIVVPSLVADVAEHHHGPPPEDAPGPELATVASAPGQGVDL